MSRSSIGDSGLRAPTDIDRAVGENLRALRLQRQQALIDLAGELSISHQQLQKYETGFNRLSVGMAARAAEKLGVPIEHLFRTPPVEGSRKRTRQARVLEDLRREGTSYLERTDCRDALTQMVQVLRILSTRA